MFFLLMKNIFDAEVILLSNHYIACVWFLIGSSAQDTEAERAFSRGAGRAEVGVFFFFFFFRTWKSEVFFGGTLLQDVVLLRGLGFWLLKVLDHHVSCCVAKR